MGYGGRICHISTIVDTIGTVIVIIKSECVVYLLPHVTGHNGGEEYSHNCGGWDGSKHKGNMGNTYNQSVNLLFLGRRVGLVVRHVRQALVAVGVVHRLSVPRKCPARVAVGVVLRLRLMLGIVWKISCCR